MLWVHFYLEIIWPKHHTILLCSAFLALVSKLSFQRPSQKTLFQQMLQRKWRKAPIFPGQLEGHHWPKLWKVNEFLGGAGTFFVIACAFTFKGVLAYKRRLCSFPLSLCRSWLPLWILPPLLACCAPPGSASTTPTPLREQLTFEASYFGP